jgi:hypothetical protein
VPGVALRDLARIAAFNLYLTMAFDPRSFLKQGLPNVSHLL